MKSFGVSFLPVEDRLLILGLRADGAHGETGAAVVVVVPIPIARIEVEKGRVAAAVREERGRPVVAVRTGIVEVTIPAIARSWEEKL